MTVPDSSGQAAPLLAVEGLQTHFLTLDGTARAVNDVSFQVMPGETLGVVGESGSGKSVTALSVMRLIRPPGRIVGGTVRFEGINLLDLSEKAMRDVRGNRIAMIFQEPMTSLNPLFPVGYQIAEMFIRHRGMSKKQALDEAVQMLDKVQIPSPGRRAADHPHQLSGGMRQRVMIAMALSCRPQILIADEPTTALDVTIQAQVIDLMLNLKETFNTAILMITHDLGVIAEIAQQVVVMYAGQVVEQGTVFDIFEDPRHPYTRALLKATPRLGARAGSRRPLDEIKGIVPSLYDLPRGCAFYPRCPLGGGDCRAAAIPLIELGYRRRVRCIKAGAEPEPTAGAR